MATTVAGALLVTGVLAIYAAASARPAEAGALALALVLGALGLAAVARIVWGAVGGALRPVRTMSGELREIADHPGEGRVSIPQSHDEVAELANSVNVTLHRLERMAERHRSFVADASHELRSPLTGLRTQLELALEHPEDEDWPKVARAALDDADRLQRIVADLLVLAKLEAGVPSEREKIDLCDLVKTETARRTGRVPIEVRFDDYVVVSASPSQLIRVLTNLLDNADRHATGRVTVTVCGDGPEAVLTVADDGPGIPSCDRERVFQRFQRLANSRHTGGTGLGLPISREIAQTHGGTLTVGNNQPGASLILRLPAF